MPLKNIFLFHGDIVERIIYHNSPTNLNSLMFSKLINSKEITFKNLSKTFYKYMHINKIKDDYTIKIL